MEQKSAAYSYLLLLKDLRKYIKPYSLRFGVGSFLRLSSDLIYLYTSYALAKLIGLFTNYVAGQPLVGFWSLLILWGITHAYVATIRQVAKYNCYQVAEKINLDSQLSALRHMSSLDISWHAKENTGNKLKRIQNGSEGLEKLLRIWVDNIIEIVVNFIGMIIIIAFIDLRVAGIMVVFLISYLLIAIPLNRRASAASREVNQHEENFGGLAFEVVNNIRTIKVMGMFKQLFPRLEKYSTTIFTTVKNRIFRYRIKSAIQSNWAHIFRIIAFLVIVYGIYNGRYEVSFLLLFNFYFTGIRSSAEELSGISEDISISRYNITRLRAILNEKVVIDNETGKGDFPRQWSKISLRNVSFSYGDNATLKNISFDINRGEKIGIVGLSGAGKSTLFKLLLKEYEDFSGDIFIDDVSIRDIKKSSFFKKVAVVLQDTEVFNFSLKDNITIAAPDVSNQAVRLKKALVTAHVNDFMCKLPHEMDTLIGEKGVRLSGGEKQRLGIARAVFKEPDILFLDEATSHLDIESEEKIKDSLHHFFKNVTAIVIAHRLTTIQEMDRILVIEQGTLCESGNFNALYKARGRFYEMWEKQKL